MEPSAIQPLLLPLPLALALILGTVLFAAWAAWSICRTVFTPIHPANWQQTSGRIEQLEEYADDTFGPQKLIQMVRATYSYETARRIVEGGQVFPQNLLPDGTHIGQRVPIYTCGPSANLLRPQPPTPLILALTKICGVLLFLLMMSFAVLLLEIFKPELLETLWAVLSYLAAKAVGGEASWPMVVKR